jgi:phosphatidylglycerophosphatase A
LNNPTKVSIKESSDELNPTVISPDLVVPSQRKRSVGDYLALTIATCGVGYIPIAPGTFGSLVGIGLFAALRGLFLSVLWPISGRNQLNLLNINYALIALLSLAAIAVSLAGIWAGSRVEKLHGAKDPQKVVIDEVAGQLIALLAVPLQIESWWTIVAAFLLFRFFDIVKPYPARRLESLHGGLGIMADDVVAGAYAGVTVALMVTIAWLI